MKPTKPYTREAVCVECGKTFLRPKKHRKQTRCSKHCQLVGSMKRGWRGPFFKDPKWTPEKEQCAQ